MTGALVVFVGLALLVIIVISRTAVVVPQQSAFVVERLGRYRATLDAGFHILLPFIDAIRYRHSLKEHAGEIPEQICITRDNVQVHVDGVLYLKVLNPERASYGVSDYLFAITQLAQTALRSEIGKIDLDKTFESRTQINLEVVNELDKATEPWGIKVLRYEIKNITPPADVLAAMEKQMRAEREKRAVILTSEGQRDAAINSAEGEKQQVIKASEAKKQQQINEAEGQAAAILAVADATAEGIRKVAEAINLPGGYEAVQLRVAEQYIGQFGQLAKESNTMVLPASVADVGSTIARRITEAAGSEQPRVYHLGWWSERLLEWAMAHPRFKTQLFRFVDVFPACHDDADVLRHLEEYFDGVEMPRALRLGLGLTERVPFGAGISAAAARRNVRRMARQLIVGAAPEDALPRLERLWRAGEASTVDLLGEHIVSEPEADRYAARVAAMLEALVSATRTWPAAPLLERDP